MICISLYIDRLCYIHMFMVSVQFSLNSSSLRPKLKKSEGSAPALRQGVSANSSSSIWKEIFESVFSVA